MKKIRFYYLLLICCISLSSSNAQSIHKTIVPKVQQTEEQAAIKTIKEFYVAYTTNILHSKSTTSNSLLMKKYLTKSLIAKVKKMIVAIDADPIIRAQDFTEEAIKTLRVKHLSKNWYMVSYTFAAFNGTTETNISLRVIKTNNRYMIDDITLE